MLSSDGTIIIDMSNVWLHMRCSNGLRIFTISSKRSCYFSLVHDDIDLERYGVRICFYYLFMGDFERRKFEPESGIRSVASAYLREWRSCGKKLAPFSYHWPVSVTADECGGSRVRVIDFD